MNHQNVVSPPGETLRVIQDATGISLEELSRRSGLSTDFLDRIIQGDDVAVNIDIASALSRATGVPSWLWSSMEANYRGHIADQVEREELLKEIHKMGFTTAAELRAAVHGAHDPGMSLDEAGGMVKFRFGTEYWLSLRRRDEEIESLKKAISILKGERDDLVEDFAILKDAKDNVGSALDGMKRDFLSRGVEIMRLDEEIKRQMETNATLKDQIRVLKQRLEVAKHQANSAIKILDDWVRDNMGK